jgi:hypothetical protein
MVRLVKKRYKICERRRTVDHNSAHVVDSQEFTCQQQSTTVREIGNEEIHVCIESLVYGDENMMLQT